MDDSRPYGITMGDASGVGPEILLAAFRKGEIRHPVVAFGILPLFALANAGVSVRGLSLRSLLDPVPLGILVGLVVGNHHALNPVVLLRPVEVQCIGDRRDALLAALQDEEIVDIIL